MDTTAQSRHKVIRTILSLAIIFLLLHLANRTDILSNLTRPIVVGLLKGLGFYAVDQAGYLSLGRLMVPWTRDCAGLNVLMVLWAVILWTNRNQPLTLRYGLRLFLAIPVAFAANVCRIITLITYRQAFYPAIESPQLHYFIGFLWLIPFLGLFVPRAGRKFSCYLLETFFLAAILSLLAPFVQAPGGSVVALSALMLLSQSRYENAHSLKSHVMFAVWLVAALFITLTSMESLWIPWMLLCPNFVSPFYASLVIRPILLAGTIPLVAMQFFPQIVILAAAILLGWKMFKEHHEPVSFPPSDKAFHFGLLLELGLAAMFLLPFIASSLKGMGSERIIPPPGIRARALDMNSFQIRLVGQSPDIELLWYGPYGEGRHHSLPVCMRYRGITLRPSGEISEVMTDGQRWMREFFFLRGEPVMSYGDYLMRTFLPLSPAGVHLIASAMTNTMSSRSFADATDQLARQLLTYQRP